MPSSSARCSQLPRASDKVPFFVALRKLRDHLRGHLPHLDESEVVFPDLDLKVEPRKDRRPVEEGGSSSAGSGVGGGGGGSGSGFGMEQSSTGVEKDRKRPYDCSFDPVDRMYGGGGGGGLPPSFAAMSADMESRWRPSFQGWLPGAMPPFGGPQSSPLVAMSPRQNSVTDCAYNGSGGSIKQESRSNSSDTVQRNTVASSSAAAAGFLPSGFCPCAMPFCTANWAMDNSQRNMSGASPRGGGGSWPGMLEPSVDLSSVYGQYSDLVTQRDRYAVSRQMAADSAAAADAAFVSCMQGQRYAPGLPAGYPYDTYGTRDTSPVAFISAVSSATNQFDPVLLSGLSHCPPRYYPQ